jgi:hypothetical protein
LRQFNTSTTAPYMRVLEWEVKRVNGGPGFINDADAEGLLDELNRNYGHMGLKYAKFLAMNHTQIKEELRLKCNWVQATVHGGQSERYWYTLVAAFSLAAKYAKACGLDVDQQPIEDFMFKVYQSNVDIREQFAEGGNIDNSETILTRYLKEREAPERVMWTDHIHNQRGKPTRPVTVFKTPSQSRSSLGPVDVRFAVENKLCVISKSDFDKWLALNKHSETQIYASLHDIYKSTTHRLALCSGWIQDAGREKCIVLHVERTTPLWNYMLQHAPADVRKAMEDANPLPEGWVAPVEVIDDFPQPIIVPAAHVETGLEPVELAIDPATGLATAASVGDFVRGAVNGPR